MLSKGQYKSGSHAGSNHQSSQKKENRRADIRQIANFELLRYEIACPPADARTQGTTNESGDQAWRSRERRHSPIVPQRGWQYVGEHGRRAGHVARHDSRQATLLGRLPGESLYLRLPPEWGSTWNQTSGGRIHVKRMRPRRYVIHSRDRRILSRNEARSGESLSTSSQRKWGECDATQ